MERNLIEHKTGNLDPEIGKEIVEDIKKLQEEFETDIITSLDQINKLEKEAELKTKLEKEAIDFYIEKCINNLNTWIVVAHHVHPTEEESLNLMFKIMDTLKELGYKYERSYNKLKVYVNE